MSETFPKERTIEKRPPVVEQEIQQEVICMGRKHTKGEELSEAIRARNAAGETNRAIGESYGLSKRQVEQLISRQNRKGRPRKEAASEEVRQHNELAKLRMPVELLQNFPSEAEMSSYRTIPRRIQCRSHV